MALRTIAQTTTRSMTRQEIVETAKAARQGSRLCLDNMIAAHNSGDGAEGTRWMHRFRENDREANRLYKLSSRRIKDNGKRIDARSTLRWES